MGDSDDDNRGEYDRRRRDKFRGERNDNYDNRRPSRGYDRGGRGDRHSNTWDRGTKRDYYGGREGGNRDRRDNFGRSSPPFKKTKREWENDQPWKGNQESNMLVPGDKNSSAPTLPVLMSFKDFITQQEDSIDEIEAVRRYQGYKVEFKRTQINDFFVLHKNEEWFEEKYHPIKSHERTSIVRRGLRKRLRVFLDLWEQGYMDDLQVNISNQVCILKLLDRAVVKLEGGSDEDMKALDLPPPPKAKDEVPAEVEKTAPEAPEEGEANESSTEEKKQDPKSYNYDADGADDEDGEPNEPLPPGIEAGDDEITPPGADDDEKSKEENEDEDGNKEDSDVQKKPEQLEYVYDGSHVKRPYSLFMRMVAANVTRADLIGVCKRYPGFLRIAMSDPSSERRYSRRAWASFDHTVNIKDICWNLSNIRVKDMELSPCVNRDVSNRVRTVNGITCSPMTMQLDINFALKLVRKLDGKHQLYVKEATNGNGNGQSHEKPANDESTANDEDAKSDTTEEEIELPESNPLIAQMPNNIEELVTGLETEDEEDDKKDYPIIVNEELARHLDLISLYLRMVHCIDYYNANEYMHEDEMPMRCGIMHVRAAPLEAASKKDVYEWFNSNKVKLEHILKNDEAATDEEAEKFGKKDEEVEVENFMKANTQELAKDKWLCPLSGKKFRGPEFIRKHILMKHNDSVDNVKTEVKFFNNYIYDMKRPCFPDPRLRLNNSIIGGSITGPLTGGNSTSLSSTPRPTTLPSSGSLNDSRNRASTPNQPVVFAPPRGVSHTPAAYPSTPQNQQPNETYGRMNTFPPKAIRRGGSGGNRGDNRRLIKYRDLDAPEESDFF